MQSCAHCWAAAGASVAATEAANSTTPGFSSASSRARAASHTAAVARSVTAAMVAHLCLMPWNWPMGRPNCSRTLAYSDAVSVAQRATPTASADTIVEMMLVARASVRLLSTRSAGTRTAVAVTCATGRSGSTLCCESRVTSSALSTTHL
ncbi:Uncharacterised protein [Mycobacteroides abscessus subsp. abscessus]|nr:Uncharacterised protein [Mycobacteroides abscessus subsp. abscessus]